MSARALIPAADLRRMAKVAKEFGVTITSRSDANGVTFQMTPALASHHSDDASDLDTLIESFTSK